MISPKPFLKRKIFKGNPVLSDWALYELFYGNKTLPQRPPTYSQGEHLTG